MEAKVAAGYFSKDSKPTEEQLKRVKGRSLTE
jgi:hypothetical protein